VGRGVYTGILISGTGGQGIIAAGEFLTEAPVSYTHLTLPTKA